MEVLDGGMEEDNLEYRPGLAAVVPHLLAANRIDSDQIKTNTLQTTRHSTRRS